MERGLDLKEGTCKGVRVGFAIFDFSNSVEKAADWKSNTRLENRKRYFISGFWAGCSSLPVLLRRKQLYL